jgi:acid phosphatase type 7
VTTHRRRHLTLAAVIGALVVIPLAVLAIPLLDPIHKRPMPPADATRLPFASPVPLPAGTVRVLAAGDIGRCGSPGAAATGAYLEAVPDATVLALGDLAYDSGSPEDFARCYDPVWGAVKDRTIPVAGNHDHRTRGAQGYVEAFGTAAGDPAAPWRAVDVGAWRLYVLDTACDELGGCGEGSAQLAWLREDLAAHPTACIAAMWHRARFSSGPHGSQTDIAPLWGALADAGADVVLAGHDHLYERFTPMDAAGRPVPGGTRSFVVGTGGGELYAAGPPITGSEALWDRAFGLLELDLAPDGYDWRFQAVLGEPFEDTGSGSCGVATGSPEPRTDGTVSPTPLG